MYVPYTMCGSTFECHHIHTNLCLTVSRSAAKIQNTYNTRILEIPAILMHSTGQAVVA